VGRARLAVPDAEASESPELDVLTPGERRLDGGQEPVDHQLAFPFGDSRPDRVYDLVNQIRFVHLFSSFSP